MLLPMAYTSSPYNPLSGGPSPSPPRRNVAAGRRVTRLPPSLRAGTQHEAKPTRSVRHPSPSSSVPRSPASTASGEASARSSHKARQDGQCRLPPVPLVGRPTPHHASPKPPKRVPATASVRRLFAGTALAGRGGVSGSSVGEVRLDKSRGVRPMSEESHRTPGFAAARHPVLHPRGSTMDVPSKPSTVASSTFPRHHPTPRGVALQPVDDSALDSGPAQRGEPRVSTMAVKHRGPSRQPAHPASSELQHASSGTVLSIAESDGAGVTCSAPITPSADCQLLSAQQKHDASVDLPYVPHDMDKLFFTDTENWRTENELPSLVWSLLEGVTLETPYTSHLWAQTYVRPADFFSAAKKDTPALPDIFMHREGQQRTNGFYACVRCDTPVCEPSHQVVPESFSLRGIAVFDALNVKGVEVHVYTPTGKGVAPPQSRGRYSSLPSFTAAKSYGRAEGASQLDAAAGGLRFLVRCRHCHGCLGVIRHGEATRAPSADASRPKVLATTSAAAPATVLFCANSVCLKYMPYRTRARLDQSIINNMAGDSGAGSSGRGGSAAAMFGTTSAAAHAQSAVTLGSLFRPQHRAEAWGVEGAIDMDQREWEGLTSYANDETSLDNSFNILMEGLDPYGGGTPMSSTSGSDG